MHGAETSTDIEVAVQVFRDDDDRVHVRGHELIAPGRGIEPLRDFPDVRRIVEIEVNFAPWPRGQKAMRSSRQSAAERRAPQRCCCRRSRARRSNAAVGAANAPAAMTERIRDA